jgi:hypothetical protein
MANTTNFGWETPDDTDLVKDGAAAMRTLGNSIDASFVDLKGGTTGQILSKASNTDLDYTWITNDTGDITGVTAGTGISGGGTTGTVTITNDMATTITAAGDIVVGTGSGTYDNLPIGTTGQVLTADTTVSPYKVKWASASSTPTFKGCRAVTTTNQTISNNTWTVLTYNSESYDTDGFHSTSTNTGRLTIPTGLTGYYLVITQAVFNTNATGARYSKIQKNGTDISVGRKMGAYSSTVESVLTGSDILYLTAGDYIEHLVYQSSGGNLSMNQDNTDHTGFVIQFLGA